MCGNGSQLLLRTWEYCFSSQPLGPQGTKRIRRGTATARTAAPVDCSFHTNGCTSRTTDGRAVIRAVRLQQKYAHTKWKLASVSQLLLLLLHESRRQRRSRDALPRVRALLLLPPGLSAQVMFVNETKQRRLAFFVCLDHLVVTTSRSEA